MDRFKQHSTKWFGLHVSYEQLVKYQNFKDVVYAFRNRINGLYLRHIVSLKNSKKSYNGFPSQILIFSLIDSLGAFLLGYKDEEKSKQRFVKYWDRYINIIINQREKNPILIINNKKLSLYVYQMYRNGLIHETRIKNSNLMGRSKIKLITFINQQGKSPVRLSHILLFEYLKESIDLYLNDVNDNPLIQNNFKRRFHYIFKKEWDNWSGLYDGWENLEQTESEFI